MTAGASSYCAVMRLLCRWIRSSCFHFEVSRVDSHGVGKEKSIEPLLELALNFYYYFAFEGQIHSAMKLLYFYHEYLSRIYTMRICHTITCWVESFIVFGLNNSKCPLDDFDKLFSK